MQALLLQMLRSRWFAWAVHLGFWLVLYLALTHLGGRAPDFREATSFSAALQSLPSVARLGSLFALAPLPKSAGATNALDPFFTSYFVPKPAPAPPAPTTRRIEVTYQGFYQTGDGPKKAIVKLADGFVVVPFGGPVATNLFVADAGIQSLTLTNPAAQTNILKLNVTKEIEVPIK